MTMLMALGVAYLMLLAFTWVLLRMAKLGDENVQRYSEPADPPPVRLRVGCVAGRRAGLVLGDHEHVAVGILDAHLDGGAGASVADLARVDARRDEPVAQPEEVAR